MTDTPDFSSIPTPTPLETVAALAAESAVRAMKEADPPEPPPATPAVDPGLLSRIAAIENAVQLLLQPAQPHPAILSEEDRRTIDDLRQGHAELSRAVRQLKKETR